MIYSSYSVDALIMPTSTYWVHGSQPKICIRDKIRYIWQFFPSPLTNKAQPSLFRVLREEDEGEPWNLPGCFFTSCTKDDLEGEPWPARVCFYILSLTNSLQLLSKQQIHLYAITNVNTFCVMRILEASAGLCLWQHWLAELARGITQHAPDSGEGSWHHCDLGYFLPGRILAEKLWGAGWSLEHLICVEKGRLHIKTRFKATSLPLPNKKEESQEPRQVFAFCKKLWPFPWAWPCVADWPLLPIASFPSRLLECHCKPATSASHKNVLEIKFYRPSLIP